ncbi:hypothetical protein CRUP_007064 [Coryphaenoides rupestris]|nr:hypothetical protein CRUP_007064 [Coryphaenoides rupestris]
MEPGVRTHYVQMGCGGPPVLLCHGFPESWYSWRYQDLITFLDKLAIPQVTLVGHDWGGALVWIMAQYYPERVRAVASLNTPLFPLDPTTDPMLKLKAIPIFDYQIYFQEPVDSQADQED